MAPTDSQTVQTPLIRSLFKFRGCELCFAGCCGSMFALAELPKGGAVALRIRANTAEGLHVTLLRLKALVWLALGKFVGAQEVGWVEIIRV